MCGVKGGVESSVLRWEQLISTLRLSGEDVSACSRRKPPILNIAFMFDPSGFSHSYIAALHLCI